MVVIVLIGVYIGSAYMQNSDIESESAGSKVQTVQQTQPSNPAPQTTPSEPQEIITASEEDYGRLEDILPQNEIIQLLPESAKIKLSFFNFNTGEREWERTYILTTGKAVQGEASLSEVDMALIMHSRNLPLLKGDNFCEVINGAQENGDFAMETEMSTISLGWKYKSIIGYKDCLGF